MVKQVFLQFALFFLLVCSREVTAATYDSLPRLDRITSAVLMSADSGQILFEQNANHRVNPGSLIQLMTLELAMEALQMGSVHLDTTIKLPEDIQQVKGRNVFVPPYENVKFHDLLESIAIVGANDACMAIAHQLAGSVSGFINRMNKKANELNLHSTRIGDSCGCIKDTNKQYTTAHDIAQLAYYHMKRHPEWLPLYSKSYFSFGGIHYKNNNDLPDYDERINALKDARINNKTFHLVSTGHWNDERYLAVIMGAKTKNMAAHLALKLLNQGFVTFENVCLFEKGDKIDEAEVWKGNVDHIPLVSRHNAIVTIPKGKKDSISFHKSIAKVITAPFGKNEKVGTLDILLNEASIKSIDIYPSHKIEKAHLLKRIWHSLLLAFKQ